MATAAPRRNAVRLDATRAGLIAALLALAAVAWLATNDQMAGLDAGPGTDPGTLGFYTGAWVVMMAAMMFPSIAPMVLAHAHIERRRRERGRAVAPATTALFIAGYLISWTTFGLAAYGAFTGVRALHIDALSWDRGGPYIAGGVIIAAAVYQLTPLKDVCLRKCRGPMDFVMGAWRDGRIGSLRMGIEHGLWCVGCCWMLMAALFALGVMSIGWMVFVAALIAIEKLSPWRRAANVGIAILLLAIGVTVAVSPEDVPGLTIPGSAKAQAAMDRMMGPSMKGMKKPTAMGGMKKPVAMGGTKQPAKKKMGGMSHRSKTH